MLVGHVLSADIVAGLRGATIVFTHKRCLEGTKEGDCIFSAQYLYCYDKRVLYRQVFSMKIVVLCTASNPYFVFSVGDSTVRCGKCEPDFER